MTTRNRWIAGGIALVLVLAGVGASVLFNDGNDSGIRNDLAESTDQGSGSGAADPVDSDDPSADTETVVGDTSGSTQLTATTRPSVRRTTPAVTDTPTPPQSNSTKEPGTTTPDSPGTKPADPDDSGLTDEEREYLEETREIVETNEASLRAAANQILGAIMTRDAATLTDSLAGDEGPQPAFITELVTRYPQITGTKPVGTVNVFSVGDATTYFTYVVVTWKDAGIVSEHTIAIPLRFVDGEWRLSSLDESAEGLTFVQAVHL